MAHDSSPPRNGTIAFYAVLTIIALVMLKFVFDSYFLSVAEAKLEQKQLTVGFDEVKAARQAELKQLRSGSLPIDQAMEALAQRGRAGFPSIAPKANDSTEALKGWAKLPQNVEQPEGEAAAQAGSPDAGTQAAPDAGVDAEADSNPSAASAEGGAPSATPDAERSAVPPQPKRP